MSSKVIDVLAAAFGRPKPVVGATPADVVHHENKWRLLRYRSEARRHVTPVLLIPSLINRHYVLDLMPGKSFVEHLIGQGHDVYIIDWGTPEDEDRYVTFDDVCDRAIGRAIRVAGRSAPGKQVHVLGYCLGGTLAAIHAAAHPEHFASLVLVAAPVRFSDEGMLTTWTRTPTFDVHTLVEARGNVPWQLMQSAFQMLRPTMGLAKAVSLVQRAWDDPFLDGFFALETWGNDNVSFPGACYATYIEELYRKDALIRGEMTLSGAPARLSSIHCPLLCVTFEHDNIVPWKSAAAVLEHASSESKEHLHLTGGHVGAMVSSSAKKKLWPSMTEFWATNEVRFERPCGSYACGRSLASRSRSAPDARRAGPRVATVGAAFGSTVETERPPPETPVRARTPRPSSTRRSRATRTDRSASMVERRSTARSRWTRSFLETPDRATGDASTATVTAHATPRIAARSGTIAPTPTATECPTRAIAIRRDRCATRWRRAPTRRAASPAPARPATPATDGRARRVTAVR